MCSCPIRLWVTLIISFSNETFNVIDFLHRDSYQRKIGCTTTTVDWVWPGLPKLVKGDFRCSGGLMATIKIIKNKLFIEF